MALDPGSTTTDNARVTGFGPSAETGAVGSAMAIGAVQINDVRWKTKNTKTTKDKDGRGSG